MKWKSKPRWKSSSGKIRYAKWRQMVFKLNKGRYGMSKFYVCLKCNKKRKTTRVMHAHHIKSWNNYVSERYNSKNGVVLCKYCHDGFHYKYKFDALKKPKLLLEYVDDKYVEEYLKK